MLRIMIDKDKCNLCTFCVEACPTECIGLSENGIQEIIITESECIICNNCEEQCPHGAITVELKQLDE